MTEPRGPRASRRVVVFGVDGVRFDTLGQAATPHIDAIAAEGFLAPVLVDAAVPTISGPVWTTMATGVLPDTHRIFDNDLRGHRIADHPDYLSRIRTVRPGARTYACAGWPQLVHETAGGPIFLGGGFLPDGADDTLGNANRRSEVLTADAVRVLGSEDVAAAFVYFVEPDEVAHKLGVCPEYVDAIERSDARIGQVLDAIQARSTYADEEWTILVATDHGHRDEGGHGGDSIVERTAWIAASGPTVPSEPPAALEQVDVHAQVLTALDIAIDPAWGLVSQPFGTRRGAPLTPS